MTEFCEANELNKDSNGGTELTTRGLIERLSPEDMDGVQLIASRVRTLHPGKKHILHCHDLAGDPESHHLRTPDGRAKFDKLVFSSNWQYQQFRDYLGVPYTNHSMVIDTGVEPLQFLDKPKDKIRLIYTSTPHRGLALLVAVFKELVKVHPELELDVFSSFGIYGPQWESRNEPFKPVFKECEDHPNINYHGWADQATVRTAYEKAHIFAYPSIWPETSCRSLIEGMSAGCLCVHPNLAALPDTSGGLTIQYNGDLEDTQWHCQTFYNAMLYAIDRLKSNDVTNYTGFVKTFADTRFGWDNIIPKWKALLAEVKSK